MHAGLKLGDSEWLWYALGTLLDAQGDKCHEERAVSAGTVAHAKVIMDRGRWAATLWDMVRSDHAGGLPGWTDGADEGGGGAAQAKRTATRAAGRPNKGPAGYPEVGCATVSFYDCEGQRLSTLRVGRIPQAKKATLKEMLSAEVTAAPAQKRLGNRRR